MLRNLIKNMFAGLLYWSGLLSFLLRRRFRDRAVVLTYHRVLPKSLRKETFSHDAIIVAPEVFARHVAALNRHFSCLDVVEFSQRLLRHDFSGPARCLITFDDAWRDNHTYAFDILKRLNTPAVVFVPTDYIGSGKLFWQERLGHLMHNACLHNQVKATEALRKYGLEDIPMLRPEERTKAIKSSIRSIKDKDYQDIERLMAELEVSIGEARGDFGPDKYLTVEQMQEMQRSGIRFESHGCSHRVLTRLDRHEVQRELNDSRRWLAETIGGEPVAFAYPNGDHDTEVAESCARSGYQVAFTTVYGHVTPESDPFTIRRVNVNDNAAPNEARLLLNLLLSGDIHP